MTTIMTVVSERGSQNGDDETANHCERPSRALPLDS